MGWVYLVPAVAFASMLGRVAGCETHGTPDSLNVAKGASLYPHNCGYLGELSKRVRVVQESVIAGLLPQGSDPMALLQEMFTRRSAALEVVHFADPWVGAVEADLLALDGEDIDVLPALRPPKPRDRSIAVPRVYDMQVLVYRKDLFDKYQHSWPATWDEFDRVVKHIQDRERATGNLDFHGFSLAMNSTEEIACTLISILTGDGGGGIVESNGTVSINNERAVRSLKRWKWWLDNVTPPAARGWGTSSALRHFLAGNSSVVMTWSSRHDELEEWQVEFRKKGWELGIVPIPGESAAGCSGSWYLALSKYTRDEYIGRRYIRVALQSLNNVSVHSSALPMTTTFFAVPERKAEYCSKWTVACESMAKYPDYWGRMSHRPGAGCGSLYPFCADRIARRVQDMLAGNVTPGDTAVLIEKDLLALLGHWVPLEGSSKQNTRVVLGMGLAVGCVVVLVWAVLIRRQKANLRRTRGVSAPVAILMAGVVIVTLLLVLPVVLVMYTTAVKRISRDLTGSLQHQSLLGAKASVEGMVKGISHQPYSWQQLRMHAVVAMRRHLSDMQLVPNALVVMLDRDHTTGHTILVSSDPSREREGGLPSPHLEGLLDRTVPAWRTTSTFLENTLQVGDHLVSALAVSFERERVAGGVSNSLHWLIAFVIDDATVTEEASDPTVIDAVIALSIVAVVVALSASSLISIPLVKLGAITERVRVLDDEACLQLKNAAEGRAHSWCRNGYSMLSEVASLVEGFQEMASSLSEVKGFLPKPIFDESTEVDQESPNKIFALQPMVLVQPMVDRTIVSVMFNFSASGPAARSPAALNMAVELIERVSLNAAGTVHQLTTLAPGRLLVTWHSDSCTRCREKAVLSAISVLKSFDTDGLRVCAAAGSGRAKIGPVGNLSTRGFAVLGPAVRNAEGLLLLSAELPVMAVVVGGRFFDKVRGSFHGRAVDVLYLPPQRVLAYVVCNHDDPWLFIRNDDVLTRTMQKLSREEITIHSAIEAISAIPSRDPLEEAVLRRLRRLGPSSVSYLREVSRRMVPWHRPPVPPPPPSAPDHP